MEPPSGFWASLWSFICFLPIFVGLLLLGIIKGASIFPFACLIITVGNSAVVLGLWPAHALWTFYCLARSKQFGPILKIVLFILIAVLVILWPLVAILGSILGGALYGFLAPLAATFEAVGEEKTDEFVHCIVDGTWTTVQGSCTVVRDFTDVCFHSYFSIMDDIRLQEPRDGKPYEIRVLLLLGSFFIGLLGIIVDVPTISVLAIFKSPFMLYKGWRRLVHDLIGREGPFLETACVPFAGLAILLWPAAVMGAVIASFLSSYFLGGYAAIVSYQESSLKLGLYYIVYSLASYDEYSNDVLDLPEGSCFPRPKYRKKESLLSGSLSRPSSFRSDKQDVKHPPSHTTSFKGVILEIKPIKMLDNLISDCRTHGEKLVSEGLITTEDIDECLSGKDGRGKVISIGLPAYSILQNLLISVKSGSDGLLASNGTEITSMNRPRDRFFDWFFDPLMIIKDQIKANHFSEDEEEYLAKLVLLQGDSVRSKSLIEKPNMKDQLRKAELAAFARRLQGITKSILRYPTVKRRFDALTKSLSEELGSKLVNNQSKGTRAIVKSKSAIVRLFSQKSLGSRASSKERAHDEDVELGNGSSHDT